MDQIQNFAFDGATGVRVVPIDGEAWFVAKDVAEALGYDWHGTSNISHVPEEWRGVRSVRTPSNDQNMAVLSEQGLYFFLARSDKPKALPFQKWIAGTVVPAIRKNGGYLSPTVDFSDPDNIQKILDAWKVDRRKLEEAKSTIVTMQPAHDFGKSLLDAVDTYFTMNEASKILEPETGMGRNILFAWLRDKKVLRENNTPYQKYIDDGYFRVTEKGTVVGPKVVTMVSNRGIDYIRKLFKKDNERA